MKTLIKNGHVIDPGNSTNRICDILIQDGRILEIGDSLELINGDLINAEGKYVLPGMVDAHCHLRDPGYEYKEDIESGTKSAALGGFTSIACMPNTNPPIDSESTVNYVLGKACQEGYVNVYPIGAITKGLKGEELAEIGELKFAGAVGISDDGNPVSNSGLMKKALQYADMFDITVISHSEDKDLAEDGVMNEGFQSTIMGLKGIPSVAESTAIARDILLAEYTGTPIHIAHVSTKESVQIIREAKQRGVKVTAETCPHYFSITESACEGFNTNAKVNPPLRADKDVKAVIEGLKDGTIDIIATDHAPHHIDEKNIEFQLAANGMVGFETAFSLAVTYLLEPGHLTMIDIAEKMSLNPSAILGLNKGKLEPGKNADITIVDKDEEFIFNASSVKSKGKNSPFDGFKLKGRIYYTIVSGKVIVREKLFNR